MRRAEAPPAGEPPRTPAGDSPGTMQAAGAQDTSAKRVRKKIPRTFNRRYKRWLNPVLDLPAPISSDFYKLRHDVLSLSRADVMRALRVSRNAVRDWETGYRRLPFSAFLALRLLAQVLGFGPDADAVAAPADPAALELAMPPAGAAWSVAPPDLADAVSGAARDQRRGRKSRAIELQQRMKAFGGIYNAAWLVRDSWHGSALRRRERVWKFANVLARELQQCRDCEALIYAVADALTSSPNGVPWES